MSTTLSPDFLQVIVLVSNFRGTPLQSAQACLLLLALEKGAITAADMPASICNGSKSLAGCATGALISMGLLEVVGRVKSPNPDANGRKCNLLRIPNDKMATARTWLRIHGYQEESSQLEMSVMNL